MGINHVETFQLTVPKNTPKTAPTRLAMAFSEAEVVRVQVVIPAGHIGLTGFRLDYGGQQVIPFTAGAWVTSDGEVIDWPLERYPTGSQWQAVGYNLDKTTAHSFYFRFLLDDLVGPDPTPGLVAPIAL